MRALKKIRYGLPGKKSGAARVETTHGAQREIDAGRLIVYRPARLKYSEQSALMHHATGEYTGLDAVVNAVVSAIQETREWQMLKQFLAEHEAAQMQGDDATVGYRMPGRSAFGSAMGTLEDTCAPRRAQFAADVATNNASAELARRATRYALKHNCSYEEGRAACGS